MPVLGICFEVTRTICEFARTILGENYNVLRICSHYLRIRSHYSGKKLQRSSNLPVPISHTPNHPERQRRASLLRSRARRLIRPPASRAQQCSKPAGSKVEITDLQIESCMRAVLLSIAPGTSAARCGLASGRPTACSVAVLHVAAALCRSVSLLAQGFCHASHFRRCPGCRRWRLSVHRRSLVSARFFSGVHVRATVGLWLAGCRRVRHPARRLSVQLSRHGPRYGCSASASAIAASSLCASHGPAVVSLGSSPGSGFGSAPAFFCARQKPMR